jgi:hypothetical protein
MLAFMRTSGKATTRKCLLFGVACGRRAWHRLPDRTNRNAVVVAERYADGHVTEEEWEAAFRAAYGTGHAAHDPLLAATTLADVAADAIARAFVGTHLVVDEPDYLAERAAQAALLRCILGNPFRPLAPRPFPTAVVGLAQAVYGGDQELHAVLADALHELEEGAAAAHCRRTLHAKGCHVVDWVLQKG